MDIVKRRAELHDLVESFVDGLHVDRSKGGAYLIDGDMKQDDFEEKLNDWIRVWYDTSNMVSSQ